MNNRDDSPLYVFDSAFEDHRLTRHLLSSFSPPLYFREDLFHLVGETRRPPYRWVLFGPERSGSSLHIDPLATSAWNTLLKGKKLWVLFPSSSIRAVVKGEGMRMKGEDSEAITYFVKVLPRIKEKLAELRREREEKQKRGEKTDYDEASLDCIEFIQYEGETVFVPGGMYHAVLNLEETIAVTQNFCSSTNFHEVWRKTRASRKHMAKRWMDKLKQKGEEEGGEGEGRRMYLQMYRIAKEMNEKDGFEFVFSEKSMKKKEKKRQEKEERKRKLAQKGKGNGETKDVEMNGKEENNGKGMGMEVEGEEGGQKKKKKKSSTMMREE